MGSGEHQGGRKKGRGKIDLGSTACQCEEEQNEFNNDF